MTALSDNRGDKKRGSDFGEIVQRFATLGIFLVLVVVASLWSDSFLTTTNILNVLRQVASGAGIVAIAAAKAGAAQVTANDIDDFALAAIALNAEVNDVAIETRGGDMIGVPVDADVVLAGDIAYERDTANRMTDWLATLARAGTQILVGDPRRTYLALDRLVPLAAYDVPVPRALEDADVKQAEVYRFREAVPCQ